MECRANQWTGFYNDRNLLYEKLKEFKFRGFRGQPFYIFTS